jgi:TonB family protein
MTNALLVAAVMLCLCAGLRGQAVSSPFTANPPDVMDVSKNHAKDPVGFELPDGRNPNNLDLYPDRVVGAIQTRWYQLVSELSEASYDRRGVTVVEFRIKRDGWLAKIGIAEKSGDGRLDSTALNAVRSVSPFNPFPRDFVAKSIGFRVHLGYNQPIAGDPCPATFPGVYRTHDGTSTPRATYSPDPEFSEDARRAKYQGTAILGLTVREDGTASDVCLLNALGHGLDEKAIDAVKRWKFQPAMKDGQPVPVRLSVEVDFRLY